MKLFKLVDCPPIGKRRIQRSDEKKMLVVDAIHVIPLTPMEYLLLGGLLSGQPLRNADLLRCFPGTYDVADEAALAYLEKYVNQLRGKLRPAGLDVPAIVKYGYILIEM